MATAQTSTKVSQAYNKTKAILSGKIEETQVQKAEKKRSQTAISTAARLSPETVASDIVSLKIQTTSALDQIHNSLLERFNTVKEVDEAIAAKRTILKDLHDLQDEADSLAILIETKKIESTQAKLEQEEARAQWAAEKAQHDKEDKAYRDEVATARRREVEQYVYDTKKARQKDQDAWEAQRRVDEAAWNQVFITREADLARQAEVYANAAETIKDLETQLAAAAAATDAEVKKQVAIATNSLKSALTHQFELERLKFENLVQNQKTEITARDLRIKELEARNVELDRKYSASTDKVQEIAVRAIEGASKQAVVVQTPSHDNTQNEVSSRKR